MASPNYYSIIIYFLFLFSMCYASEFKFHTLDISRLYEVSNCINSSTTTTGSSNSEISAVLEVYHRRGLCTDGQTHTATSSSLTAEEILYNDQLRVKSINDKMMDTNTNEEERVTTNSQNIHTADLPVQSGLLYDAGNYIVPIGLGTPTRKLHLMFDTGSDITWTQCQPCSKHCYKQRDHIFNPLKSTSYYNISCTDPKCPQSSFSCYHRVTCTYGLLYGDRSYTIGFLAKDKLTLTRNDVFPNFVWGCGQNNTGLFGKTAGLLGLSRGNLSVVSQTAKKYGQYFSYRLPQTLSSKGHLTFGKNNIHMKHVKFTSLFDVPQYPYFYFIKIISITVGETLLRINYTSVFKKDNTIIDSGTVITRLPQEAYTKLSEEFKHQMNTRRYPIAPAFSILDTCFHVPNDTTDIVFPHVSFTFEDNITVDLDPSGVVYAINSTLVCLGFANNTDPTDFSIFGNTQQKNMEVVYDVAGGKLGFGR